MAKGMCAYESLRVGSTGFSTANRWRRPGRTTSTLFLSQLYPRALFLNEYTEKERLFQNEASFKPLETQRDPVHVSSSTPKKQNRKTHFFAHLIRKQYYWLHLRPVATELEASSLQETSIESLRSTAEQRARFSVNVNL